MAESVEVLQKIRALEKLAESGFEDPIITQTVDKLISYRMNREKNDLQEIRAQLSTFEDRFKVDSKTFHQKFEDGELGDDEEFFVWDALIEMEKRIIKRLNILGETAP